MTYINKRVLVLHLTDDCNLRCRYCYIKKSGHSIKPAIARKAIDFIVKFTRRDPYTSVIFIGGEPLLKLDYMKKLMTYARGKGVKSFGIISNGTLLDRRNLDFLAENRFFMHLSLDGVKKAQDSCRPMRGGKGSFAETDSMLERLGGYAGDFQHLEIRHTFTPETAHLLADSIAYYASKSFSEKARICVMPALLPTGLWNKSLKTGKMTKIFREQMSKIVKLCADKLNQRRLVKVYYNECVTNAPPLISGRLVENLSCCPGTEHINVNNDGDIYPCHVPGSMPGINGNSSFCMGNVFEGITRQENAGRFCGFSHNKYLSCPHWNRLETGDPARPAAVYAAFFLAWREGVRNMRATLGKKIGLSPALPGQK